jgi:L-ascorbate peroxidase
MGFTNREIVALCGGHTLGRAFQERTHVCSHSSGEQGSTPFTKQSATQSKSSLHKLVTGDRGSEVSHKDSVRDRDKEASDSDSDSDSAKEGIGCMSGGISFTKNWLRFDNSFYRPSSARLSSKDHEVEVEDLLLLPTDKVLFVSPEFKQYSDLYQRDQQSFFDDYAKAHKKMSELGVRWRGQESQGAGIAMR